MVGAGIGDLIKYERIRQGMKQAVLARGICSISYLSKIENNSVQASDDIIIQLLKRLNINYEDVKKTKDQEIEFQNYLKNIYKEVTINKDRKYARKKLNNLLDTIPYYSGNTLFSLLLVIIKIQLSINEIAESKKNIDFLKNVFFDLTKSQQYILTKNEGIYLYKLNDFLSSSKKFEKALDLAKETRIPDWELADLNYCFGLTLTRIGKTANALEYINKALEYYRNFLIYHRLIECYILLGICYKRLGNYQKALDIYSVALKVADDLKLDKYRGKIKHNIGEIYTNIDIDKAIEFYKESLKYKIKPNDRLLTILSVVEEYMKVGDIQSANYWITEGNKIISENTMENSVEFKKYHYHFAIYNELCKSENLSEEIVISAIEYFEKIKDFESCYKYSKILGDYLYKINKYKSSATIYKRAHLYIDKIINGGGDLKS